MLNIKGYIAFPGRRIPRHRWTTERQCSLEELITKMRASKEAPQGRRQTHVVLSWGVC